MNFCQIEDKKEDTSTASAFRLETGFVQHGVDWTGSCQRLHGTEDAWRRPTCSSQTGHLEHTNREVVRVWSWMSSGPAGFRPVAEHNGWSLSPAGRFPFLSRASWTGCSDDATTPGGRNCHRWS